VEIELSASSQAAGAHLTGGCQCGAVRYALSAAPVHVSVCHCRMCQKASGGPFMAFARVKKEHLRWTRGTPGAFRSSSLVERQFCDSCGTPLTYNFLEGPNISVSIGSLDRPASQDPELQYCIESELPWLAAMRALPGKRAEEYITPERAARFVNYQHPDHDT